MEETPECPSVPRTRATATRTPTSRPPLASMQIAALLAAVLLGCFFDLKARREEAWLVAAYPAYAAYRARVRKLVPFIH